MIAGFNINRINYSTAYDVSERVLFKRYKTDPMICLYKVISLLSKRETLSSFIDLSTIPVRINRLVEFVFVIFV